MALPVVLRQLPLPDDNDDDSDDEDASTDGATDINNPATALLQLGFSTSEDSSCRDYFEREGQSDMKVLFAMATGMTKTEKDANGNKIRRPFVDYKLPPLLTSNRKKHFTPNATQLRNEVI